VLTDRQLNSIARFQEQNRRFFSSTRLREFSEGGPPPTLPPGATESERRGRTFFEDVTPSPGGKEGVCGMCHSGPLLNQVNAFGERETGVPAGAKIGNALVAETNALRNPTFTFLVDGPGSRRAVIIADPGIMLTPRSSSPQMSAFVPTDLHPAELAGFFKTPSLWGVARTPPYFHDNSAKTLRAVVDHYADVFFRRFPVAGTVIELTEQDRQDIVAFLESL
jgi:cytochrome c peroxidase